MRARGCPHSERAMNAGRAILDADRLGPARLIVDLNPAEARQHIGDLAMHDMATVEFGRDLHSQPQLTPRVFHRLALRDRADEVAAETDEGADFAFEYALAGFDGVDAFLRRRLELIEFFEFVVWNQLGLLSDPDCALTLHV